MAAAVECLRNKAMDAKGCKLQACTTWQSSALGQTPGSAAPVGQGHVCESACLTQSHRFRDRV